ncbi:uncharacterized protein CDAR_201741 [Caerostris darwini]|uniref:Uncharacterized protein n=1 Tax=Caerostris darwini TaxID=1538125 RepID=A0AAV4N2S3_9ARAC|nr:uncharacterized protein CDAR_201741 [Caerostris darwini]
MSSVEHKLLKKALLQQVLNTKNPNLTHDALVLRVLQRIAKLAHVSWDDLMDICKQGACRLDSELHELVLDIWEKRKQPTMDEQHCVERILARDYVRSVDLLKWAQILAKSSVVGKNVWKLFAVDGSVGNDLNKYVDRFRWTDGIKAIHVSAVRMLYEHCDTPEQVKSVVENALEQKEDSLAQVYVDCVGKDNLDEIRKWLEKMVVDDKKIIVKRQNKNRKRRKTDTIEEELSNGSEDAEENLPEM